MFKILLFVKRKAGMSFIEFRDYYETTHAPLAIEELKLMRRYVRNYVLPTPEMPEPEFDVMTELWFDDDSVVARMAEDARTRTTPNPLFEDEVNLMDRDTMRTLFVEERISQI